MLHTRREFLKFAGATGLAISAVKFASIKPNPLAIGDIEEEVIIETTPSQFIIDLEKCSSFTHSINNNASMPVSVDGRLRPSLGRIEETIQVDIASDPVLLDLFYKEMVHSTKVLVVHAPLQMRREAYIERASIAPSFDRGIGSPILAGRYDPVMISLDLRMVA